MGLLIDGKWVDQWYDTKSTGGRFVRQQSQFRNKIGDDSFPAIAGRYHLYISHACPWAHRTMIYRKLKGLEELVPITVVEPVMAEHGWVFAADGEPNYHKKFLHQIYTTADPQYTGRVTVPVLWDKQTQTIVNNESSEIIRMFNSAFDGLTGNQHDFYPKTLRTEIDALNDFIYPAINNGVYKSGFATEQAVYEEAVRTLFAALDELDQRLGKNRYLTGASITEADWRLFTTLIRFDPVYVGHFKCNIRTISEYPNLSGYLRELYQYPGISDTVHFDHIKTHYYASHATINPTAIVPLGPQMDLLAAHGRDHLA